MRRSMPSRPNAFLASFLPFQARVAELGIYNSLAQLMIKVTAPGIPDFYQGTELWDLNLVDPDNRRPVDYDVARAGPRVAGRPALTMLGAAREAGRRAHQDVRDDPRARRTGAVARPSTSGANTCR